MKRIIVFKECWIARYEIERLSTLIRGLRLEYAQLKETQTLAFHFLGENQDMIDKCVLRNRNIEGMNQDLYMIHSLRDANIAMLHQYRVNNPDFYDQLAFNKTQLLVFKNDVKNAQQESQVTFQAKITDLERRTISSMANQQNDLTRV